MQNNWRVTVAAIEVVLFCEGIVLLLLLLLSHNGSAVQHISMIEAEWKGECIAQLHDVWTKESNSILRNDIESNLQDNQSSLSHLCSPNFSSLSPWERYGQPTSIPLND